MVSRRLINKEGLKECERPLGELSPYKTLQGDETVSEETKFWATKRQIVPYMQYEAERFIMVSYSYCLFSIHTEQSHKTVLFSNENVI